MATSYFTSTRDALARVCLPLALLALALAPTTANATSATVTDISLTNGGRPFTPVIRVRGVDAAYAQESYVSASTARLTVATDARTLRLEFLRSGPSHDPRLTNFDVFGPKKGEPAVLAWDHPDASHSVDLP